MSREPINQNDKKEEEKNIFERGFSAVTSVFSSAKGSAAGYKGVPGGQDNSTHSASNERTPSSKTEDSNTRGYPNYGTFK